MFLLFIDKLFGSVNSSSLDTVDGKKLRSAIKDKSPHNEFWDEATSIRVLQTKRKNVVTPSGKNWITTMRGLKYVWEKLQKDGFKFLCLRNFNQDPLESFFGAVWQVIGLEILTRAICI